MKSEPTVFYMFVLLLLQDEKAYGMLWATCIMKQKKFNFDAQSTAIPPAEKQHCGCMSF